MLNRRRFLESAIASVTLPALAAALPKAAFATTGNMNPASWASATDPDLFARTWNNRFTNILPWALDPGNQVFANAGVPIPARAPNVGFVYHADAGTSNLFSIQAGQTDWPMLAPLGNSAGLPTTKVFGYGNAELGALGLAVTHPGRTFVVNRGTPITVHWSNGLVDDTGSPLPHLVAIDQTISMQTDPKGDAIDGIPIAIHHHGGNTATEFDGGPDQWFTPERRQVGPGVSAANAPDGKNYLSYQYLNDQEASMHWYHDHGLGVTRVNAYAGLAGLLIVRDANEAALIKANLLPGGPYELPIVLQDKIFAADGSLAYTADVPALNGWNETTDPPTPISVLPGFDYDPANPDSVAGGSQPTHAPEMFGDVMVVNGVVWPTLAVEPRQYRVRLLNGSDSRIYNLNFGGVQFWQIGTDVGLLNKPVQMSTIKICPGERKDIVIDFADRNGKTLVVTNDAPAPYPSGDAPGPGTANVMQITVNLKLNTRTWKATRLQDNTTLRGLDAATPLLPIVTSAPGGVTVRRIMLGEGCDQYGRVMPLLGTVDEGTKAYYDPIDIQVPVGTTEVWEFWNTTVDAHPIHMHLVQFRIVDRQPFTGSVAAKPMANGWTGVQFTAAPRLSSRGRTAAPAHEQGWKDTVECPPGYVTRVMANFERKGKYVYHCHILGHEEHDMMRWYEVV